MLSLTLGIQVITATTQDAPGPERRRRAGVGGGGWEGPCLPSPPPKDELE